ncbi:hypothetical protein IW262DRAFT_1465428 [Armillaria fumosa]|nr:hypothetical protein IW262DRAFT_1465428 [Armillaria fumosa]
MSCLSCSNCGFVNFLPPESQPQLLKTIQSSDSGLVSQLLRGSRPFLDDGYALISAEIVKLERLRSLYDAQLQEIESRRRPVLKSMENRKSILSVAYPEMFSSKSSILFATPGGCQQKTITARKNIIV